MSSFTPAQLRELRALIPPLADATMRGQFPGFGSGQTDTYTASDNVDATHPLNIRYLMPQNFQRLTAVRLSFHLAAFRSYETGVASATTAAKLHVHFWSGPGGGTSAGGSVAVNAGGLLVNTGVSAVGKQTSTEMYSLIAAAQASVDTAIEGFDSTGHTHTVTPNLTYGVFEGASAAGVTISFDGVDQTTALGGPWSVDVIELDVRAFVATTPGAYHTIALQPNGLGRIEAHMRLSSYVDSRGNA